MSVALATPAARAPTLGFDLTGLGGQGSSDARGGVEICLALGARSPYRVSIQARPLYVYVYVHIYVYVGVYTCIYVYRDKDRSIDRSIDRWIDRQIDR